MSNTTERKKASQKKTTASCEVCGESYIKTRAWKKYCSAGCRFKMWDVNNPRVKKGK